MHTRDPQLAAKAATIALSNEIPPQAGALRLNLVAELSDEHPRLSWTTYTENIETVMAPYANLAPFIIAQYGPETFWNAVPLDQLEAWIKAHVPPEMSPQIARGMELARFKLAQKTELVQAADRYMASQPQSQHVSGSPARGAFADPH
jgi:aminopeptidase N